jgi:hypothetical protein
MSLSQFNGPNFIANIATLLGISMNRIKIADVRSGSVIVDWIIDPLPIVSISNTTFDQSGNILNTTSNSTNSTSNTGNYTAHDQYAELQQIVSNFTQVANLKINH